jgi:hypothetical protein
LFHICVIAIEYSSLFSHDTSHRFTTSRRFPAYRDKGSSFFYRRLLLLNSHPVIYTLHAVYIMADLVRSSPSALFIAIMVLTGRGSGDYGIINRPDFNAGIVLEKFACLPVA